MEEKCRPLLRAEQTIQLRRDASKKIGSTDGKKAARQQTRTALPDDIDVGLWEALRECRRLLAEEQGVPPYVIFHDRSLKEMCALQPRTLLEFGRITGVGERKLDKYGAAFLRVINDYL